VLVKHDNHLPTNAFKARNTLSFMTALSASSARRVVAATRGNHGAGLAWAARSSRPGRDLRAVGNNPEKNAASRARRRADRGGPRLRRGVEVAQRSCASAARDGALDERCHVIAGAATLSAEICEQAGELDAIVVAIGGGSQRSARWSRPAPCARAYRSMACRREEQRRSTTRGTRSRDLDRRGDHVRRWARDARHLRPDIPALLEGLAGSSVTDPRSPTRCGFDPTSTTSRGRGRAGLRARALGRSSRKS